ncbi:MAG: EAL domain-containing protein [Dehalococcoidia bacterium]|nr:EAL domain-containing protein [Dehalococcoidia bacterium]
MLIAERRAQEALEQSEERYRELFENANDMVYTHDMHGRFTAVNRAFERISGYTRSELLEMTATNLIVAEGDSDPDRPRDFVSQGHRPGTSEVSVCHIKTKDGAHVPVEISNWLVYRGSEPVGVQGIGRDITERREMERAERQQRQIQALNAEIGVALSAGESMGDSLRLCIDALAAHTDADFALIWALDDDGQTLVLQNRGTAPQPTARVGIGELLVGRIAQTRQPYLTNQLPQELPTPWILASGSRSFLGHPLIADERLYGVMALTGRDSFDSSMVELLSPVAHRVALVVAQKRAEEALQSRERRFRALVQNASDIIAVLDSDGRVQYVSPAVERVLGYKAGTLEGTNSLAVIHPDDRAKSAEAVRDILPEPRLADSLDIRVRHTDGSWRILEVTGSNLLDDPSVRGIVINAEDVTQRRHYEDELKRQAFYEPLTGLPNRALFLDRLTHALASRARNRDGLAVLFIDLDRFKLINDTFGHRVGDQLLVAVARRLQSCLRAEDTISRFGGDEFTILLERLPERRSALETAERVLDAMREPFQMDQQVFITASIGIAHAEARLMSPDDILRQADMALYRAKARGKARALVFEQQMNQHAIGRFELENGLRQAIARRQIEVHYQPGVDLVTGEILGVEALARWRYKNTYISPESFIPVAEETGLILPLGLAVLESACVQGARWRRKFGDRCFAVSVNISARQLEDSRDFVADVERVLQIAGLPPEALLLEITESVAVQEAPMITSALRRLKDLGVRIAIDDFGTGYSSLTYLTRLPADTIKIDQSFVNGLEHSEAKASIVRALVSLAQRLDMDVTAEGIETQEQIAVLRDLGCLRGQGFLFAPPMPARQVGRVLRRRSLLPRAKAA